MSFIPFNDRGKGGVTIDGLEDIIRALDALPREMGQAKRRALQEAANFMVREAQSRVHVVTGRLKKSIKVESVTTDEATVIAETHYAQQEESRQGIKVGVNTPHQFMLPSSRATALQFPKMIIREIDAVLAKNKTL
jgi:HK97 gp10 family phage protein